MMNESFEVIVDLLHGKTVNRKTDWFNLTEAQLQLLPYTRPDDGACRRRGPFSVGSLCQAKFGVGMLSIGGTSPMAMEAHTEIGASTRTPHAPTVIVPDRKNCGRRPVPYCRDARQARKNCNSGCRPLPITPRCRHLPDHSAGCARSDRC